MADKTVTVTLKAQIAGYKAAMADAANTAQTTAGKVEEAGKSQSKTWDNLVPAMTTVGAGLTSVAGIAVKKFADFDAAMSNVKASTHETESNMQLLREAAVKAGADTAYSATEAAQGIDELAKAGVSTKDILAGGLDGALALAAAGQLDVADASEIAASTLTQFGLSGRDVSHVADLLAAGAGKAQGSVGDLGQALNQSGLVASQAGISLEETTGTLAAFASAGLVGSDAGTSFKTMLQKLQNPSKEAANTMKELGINMYDSQGEFVGMSNLAEQLKQSMENLTPAQRDAAMATIFGSDAVRAANVLYSQGGEGIQEWISKVDDAGYAAETAAAKQDNLKGDLEKLGGAFDTLFLQSGSGMNDFLRSIVQGTESVVDALGRIPAPVLEVTGLIAGVGGAAMLTAGLVSKSIGVWNDFRGNLDSVSGVLKDSEGNLTKWGRSANFAFKAAAGATALTAVVEGFAAVSRAAEEANISTSEIGNKLADTANGVANVDESFRNASWANGNGSTYWDGTVEGINGVADALVYLENQSGMDKFYSSGNKLIGFSDSANQARDAISTLDEELANTASGGSLDQATEAFAQWAQQAEKSGVSAEKAAEYFPQLKAAVLDYASSLNISLTDQEVMDTMLGNMPPKLTEAANAARDAGDGSNTAADGLTAVGEAAEEAQASLKDVTDTLTALGGAQRSMTDAQASYSESTEALSAALQANVFQLDSTGKAFDTTTEAGRNAQSAFNDTAESGWNLAEAMANNGASATALSASLQETYNDLVNNATQFGLTSEQADVLARATMGIPANVDINTWMSDAAKQMADSTDKAVDAIPGDDYVTSGMSPNAKNMADATKRSILDIPLGKKISSWMSGDAKNTADATKNAVERIPGSKNTHTSVTGSAANDAFTIKRAVDNIPASKTVTISIRQVGESAAAIGRSLVTGRFTGGFAGSNVRGFAGGGRLIPGTPPTNPQEDNLWAVVTDTGEPIRVRSREFISNEPAVRRGNNLAWLRWMNAGGTMSVPAPRGFAVGGMPVSVGGQVSQSAAVNTQEIASAVASAVSNAVGEIGIYVSQEKLGRAVAKSQKQLTRGKPANPFLGV